MSKTNGHVEIAATPAPPFVARLTVTLLPTAEHNLQVNIEAAGADEQRIKQLLLQALGNVVTTLAASLKMQPGPKVVVPTPVMN